MSECGDRTMDVAYSDWLLGFFRLSQSNRLVVRVTKAGESDDLLVSFHQGSVSKGIVLLAKVWWDVSNYVGPAMTLFQFIELTFKPRQFIAWIVPILNQPEIKSIT